MLSSCCGVTRFSRCKLQQQESTGLQVKYPENFFLLRGNHECASINRIYGFYDECKRRYNIRLWKTFTDCFNCLPVAALVDEKVCHTPAFYCMTYSCQLCLLCELHQIMTIMIFGDWLLCAAPMNVTLGIALQLLSVCVHYDFV